MHTPRRRLSTRVFSALVALVFTHASFYPAFALPRGERVTRGAAGFERNGDTLVINQGSAKAVIEYDGFDIGSAETVRFVQPGSSAAALNRVTGGSASTIAGALQANGNVFLVNPAGVIFTGTAQVDVHGLVASAMNISDTDFLDGKLAFSGRGGSVVNHGAINASFAYLIGGSVENNGAINAADVALQAGQGSIVLGEAEGGQIQLVVSEDEPVAPADPAPTVAADPSAPVNGDLVNRGTVNASGLAGGRVQAGGNRVANLGAIVADATAGKGGVINLLATEQIVLGAGSLTSANGAGTGDGGQINLIAREQFTSAPTSVISARGGSQGGNGGFVETSGLGGFRIGAAPVVAGGQGGRGGEWRIDPYDIEIVSSVSANQNMLTWFSSPWQPTGQDAQVAIAEIQSFFTSGGGDTLRINTADDFDSVSLGGTVRDPYQLGNITLVDNFDLNGIDANRTAPTPYTLILQAHNNIVLNGVIGDSDTSSPDALNLVLEADWQQLPVGDPNQTIRPNPNPQIPNLVIDGPDGDGLGDVFFNANLSTYGGRLTASGQNIHQDAASTITLAGGELRLTGDIDLDGTGDITLDGTITSGLASLNAENITIGGSVTVTDSSLSAQAANHATVNGTVDLNLTSPFGSGIIAIRGDVDHSGAGDVVIGATGRVETDGAMGLYGQTVRVRGTLVGNSSNGYIDMYGADGVTIEASASVNTQGGIYLHGDEDADGAGNVIADARLATTGYQSVFASGFDVRLRGGVSSFDDFSEALGIEAMNDAEVAGFTGGAGADVNIRADFDADGHGAVNLTGDVTTFGGGIFLEGQTVTTQPGVLLATEGGDIGIISVEDLHLGLGGALDTTYDPPVSSILAGKGPFYTGIISLEASCLGDVLLGSDLLTGGGAVLITAGNIVGPGHINTTGPDFQALGSITLRACDNINTSGNYISDGHDIRLDADTDANNVGDLTTTGTMQTQGGVFHGFGVNASVGNLVQTQGGLAEIIADRNASANAVTTAGGHLDILAAQDALFTGAAGLHSSASTAGGHVHLRGTTAFTGAGATVDTDGGYVLVEADDGITLGLGGLVDTTPNNRIQAFQPPIAGQILLAGDFDADCLGAVDIGSDLVTQGSLVQIEGGTIGGLGDITTSGARIHLAACVGINISGNYTSSGGAIHLDANTQPNTIGNLTSTGTMDSGTGRIDAFGNNVSLLGSSLTDGGEVFVQARNDATLGLVDTRGFSIGASVYVYGNSDALGGGNASLQSSVHTGGGNLYASAQSVFFTPSSVSVLDTDGGWVQLLGTQGVTTGANGTIDTRLAPSLPGGPILPAGTVILDGDFNDDCLGDLLLDADVFSGGAAVTLLAANITGAGDVTSDGGVIGATACDHITLSGSFSSSGAAISLAADHDNNRVGNATFSGPANTGGGAFDAYGVNADISGTLTTVGGAVTVNALDHASLSQVNARGGSAFGHVNVNADQDADTTGNATLRGEILTNAGHVQAVGENVSFEPGTASAIDTDGGFVEFRARSAARLGANGTVDTRPDAILGAFSVDAIIITADANTDGAGDALVDSDLITGGGEIEIRGNAVTGSGDLDSNGGPISGSARAQLNLTGNLTSRGGNQTYTADNDASGNGDASLSGSVNTGGGQLQVFGQNVDVSGGVITQGGHTLLEAVGEAAITTLDSRGGAGGNLTLWASSVNAGVGDAVIRGTVQTGGGNVEASGRHFYFSPTSNAMIDTDGGYLQVRTTGGLTTGVNGLIDTRPAVSVLSGLPTTAAGAINLNGDFDANCLGAVTVNADMITGGSDVALIGGTITGDADITTNGGRIDADACESLLLGGVFSTSGGAVDLLADSDANGSGDATRSAAGATTTAGGTYRIGGVNTFQHGGVTTSGARLDALGRGNVTVTGNLSTQGTLASGGEINLSADEDANGTGVVSSSGNLDTDANVIRIYGQEATVGGALRSRGGNMVVDAAGHVQLTGLIDSRVPASSNAGYVFVRADSSLRQASDGAGDLTLAGSAGVELGNGYFDGQGVNVFHNGSISADAGSIYLTAGNSISQTGGTDTFGGYVLYRAGDSIRLTDSAYIDSTGGQYYGDIQLLTKRGDIVIGGGTEILTDMYGNVCLEAGSESAGANILLDGEIGAQFGNIEAVASGDIVIGASADVYTTELGFLDALRHPGGAPALSGARIEDFSGDIILLAGHAPVFDYNVYGYAPTFDGAGDLIQNGGLVESESGHILGVANNITQNAGEIDAWFGTTGLYAHRNIQVDGEVYGDEVLLEADGSVEINGLAQADTQVLVEANGGSVTGSGLLTAPNVGIKAHGDIGSASEAINVNASSLLLFEQTADGDIFATLAGVDPSLGTLSGYLSLDMLCYSGKGGDFTAYGPDITINGQITLTPEKPRRRPDPEPQPGGSDPDPIPVPVSLPPVDISALLAKFFVDVPNFKERAKIFEEFFFLHLTMQISEFAMNLDLNFIDYLLFGEARIHANAQLPADAKDTVYIGGIRPYRTSGGGKAPGYQGTVQ